MSNEIFKVIKESIHKYKYTSLEYTQYENVESYEVLSNNKDLILLQGYNKEMAMEEYHWAANKVEALLKEISKDEEKAIITFIPDEWVEEMEKHGFKTYALWNDYFNNNIEDTIKKVASLECPLTLEVLKEENASEISELTMECRGQTRGFNGATESWVKAWLKNQDPSLKACNGKNAAILGFRKDKRLVGVVCAAIYDHNSNKGPILWIREIAVSPKHQGQSIGKCLLKEAFHYGRRQGAKRAFLMADECNTAAIKLYTTFDFICNPEEKQRDMHL
ncbi:GNAT family N-acetyltransferase [Alloiococcus sp. CFN-8]|uniref:GNAT family N-acetyltransferase n=1 Tax=Alloiococcus sp. CFN-8 TaxID=3416081 RepID=UPI003CEC6AAE